MVLGGLHLLILVVLELLHSGVGQTFESHCSSYTVHKPSTQQLTTWNESLHLCSLNNSQLVSIEDKNELNFLEENLRPKRYPKFEYFIGLRKSFGKWTWISNNSIEVAPYKHPWASRSTPDGIDTHCAKMYFKFDKHFVYDDIHCNKYKRRYVGYICEKHVGCQNEKAKTAVPEKHQSTTLATTKTLPTTSTIHSTSSVQQQPTKLLTGRQRACSCYSFEDGITGPMTWQQASASCKSNNKHLVAVETLQEWEFINKTIKDLTSVQENEWHIGLFKNLTTGNWTWINDRRLTIDKWQKNNPEKDDFYALIAREFPLGSYGLFGSIKGHVQRGWICEEETDNCEGTCTFQYPPPTTTAPTRSTITEIKESTRPPSTADDRTYLSESTTLPTVPSKDALEGEKNGSTTIIVAASLGALLFVALIVLAVILLLRRKKRRGKDAERPDTTASKQTESQYESVNPVEAAKLLGTPDLNATKGESPKVECEYAVVNKANKKPKKGDLVYAELADFDDSTNDEKAAQKPAPYETTVYADVVPTDVYHKASPDPSHPTYANVKSTGV